MLKPMRFWSGLALGGVLLTGCGGSVLSANTDEPVDTDYTSCSQNSECAVVPLSCCGTCGVATRGDAVAVRKSRVEDYPRPDCGTPAGCPLCAGFDDSTLLATCRAGRCELVDLREDPSTACAAAANCQLRSPDCCPCSGRTDALSLIAVSSETYADLVCDADMACAECAPVYDDLAVSCVRGHCAVELPGD